MSEIVEQVRARIQEELEAAKVGDTSQNTNFIYRVKLDIVDAYEDSIANGGVASRDDVCAELLKLDDILGETYKFFLTKKNYYPFETAAAMAVELVAEEVTSNK